MYTIGLHVDYGRYLSAQGLAHRQHKHGRSMSTSGEIALEIALRLQNHIKIARVREGYNSGQVARVIPSLLSTVRFVWLRMATTLLVVMLCCTVSLWASGATTKVAVSGYCVLHSQMVLLV